MSVKLGLKCMQVVLGILGLYLNDIDAGVQVDGALAVLVVLLVLVGVEDVGAVGELGQVEVPPLKGLKEITEADLVRAEKE